MDNKTFCIIKLYNTVHLFLKHDYIPTTCVLQQGKSLSLICGALRWLKDFEAKQQRELEELLEAQRKE